MTANNRTPVDFCGEIRHETDLAYCVYDGENEVWIPKSQIIESRRIGDAHSDDFEFIIPMWLAVEKGIF